MKHPKIMVDLRDVSGVSEKRYSVRVQLEDRVTPSVQVDGWLDVIPGEAVEAADARARSAAKDVIAAAMSLL